VNFKLGKCDYFVFPGTSSYNGHCLLVDERGEASRYEDDDNQDILYPCFDVLRERDVDAKERVRRRLVVELEEYES
jgi:hypothetical protein